LPNAEGFDLEGDLGALKRVDLVTFVAEVGTI
jgi:hypothetical protein